MFLKACERAVPPRRSPLPQVRYSASTSTAWELEATNCTHIRLATHIPNCDESAFASACL